VQTIEPLVLYFWPTQNGYKITIMLEELGLPYTLRMVDVDGGGTQDPEFLKVAPNNKLPVLIDPNTPDREPMVIFESAAILLYLGRTYGGFIGDNERKRSEIEQWLIWQVAGVGPMLGQIHQFVIFAPEKIPYAIDKFKKEGARLYGVLERRLEGREYVCGDYSVADMAIFPWTRPWRVHGVKAGQYPNWERWFATMNARPAVQRALRAGGEITERIEGQRAQRNAEFDRLAALEI
jgi:GSH-dependent disulfide-bond oxidoreductase